MIGARSVVTKDMNYNEIYAGSPAKSISDKIGFQFKEVSISEKMDKMKKYLSQWNSNAKNIKIIEDISEIDLNNSKTSYFNVSDRTYTKTGSDLEIEFMKFLLPAKAKFIPLI